MYCSVNVLSNLVEATVASAVGVVKCRDQADGAGLRVADNSEDEVLPGVGRVSVRCRSKAGTSASGAR